jgi:Xaa-Pro aminopeptidase
VKVVTDQNFLPQLETLLQGNIRQELAFSNTEYRARKDRTIAAMKKRGIDLLITGSNPSICYLTGFQYTNTDYSNFLLLRADGHAAMVVAGTELATVVVHGWIRDIKEFSSWNPVDALPLVTDYIADWKLEKANIGFDQRSEVFDPRAYKTFREAFPSAKYVDASDVILGLRTIKSETEIGHLNKAAHYSDLGMLAAFSTAAVGRTENDVAAAASGAMFLAGSEYFSTAPTIAAGKRTGQPRAMFKRGKIANNDPLTIEFAGVFQRYSAPISRSIVLGKPSSDFKCLAEASLGCLDVLFESVEPKRPIKDTAKALRRKLRSIEARVAPLPSFGVGVGVGMPPTWREDWLQIDESSERKFEKGMAFYSPVRLCMPGKMGVCFGETWIVTTDGVRRLSTLPTGKALLDSLF